MGQEDFMGLEVDKIYEAFKPSETK